MVLIRAIILSFSTYTRLPMPQVKWDSDAMGFAISFLPAVGVVIGVAIWCWQALCTRIGFSGVMFAAVSTALPIIITGGIHLDGYCDTSDALASWQNKERALEILKDPHVGAFALIRVLTYIIVYFAVLYELYERNSTGIAWVFPTARCLAVWSAMTMKNPRKDGMLYAFTHKVDRRKAGAILALLSVFSLAGWIFNFHGLMELALAIPITIWYRYITTNRFGGVTGDTTGFYLQTMELALLASVLLRAVVENI